MVVLCIVCVCMAEQHFSSFPQSFSCCVVHSSYTGIEHFNNKNKARNYRSYVIVSIHVPKDFKVVFFMRSYNANVYLLFRIHALWKLNAYGCILARMRFRNGKQNKHKQTYDDVINNIHS